MYLVTLQMVKEDGTELLGQCILALLFPVMYEISFEAPFPALRPKLTVPCFRTPCRPFPLVSSNRVCPAS